MSPTVRGQAIAEYVLLLSGVVIVCIVVLVAIGQAIPWSNIVDRLQLVH